MPRSHVIHLRCPRCGSLLYFETIMKMKQSDNTVKSRVYRQCDACHFTYDEVTAADVLVIS